MTAQRVTVAVAACLAAATVWFAVQLGIANGHVDTMQDRITTTTSQRSAADLAAATAVTERDALAADLADRERQLDAALAGRAAADGQRATADADLASSGAQTDDLDRRAAELVDVLNVAIAAINAQLACQDASADYLRALDQIKPPTGDAALDGAQDMYYTLTVLPAGRNARSVCDDARLAVDDAAAAVNTNGL